MERLEQRITELERRASRYRNALVLLVVGMCAVAVVGATNETRWGILEDGSIWGKRLILMNDEGVGVVSLFSDANGNGRFMMETNKDYIADIYQGKQSIISVQMGFHDNGFFIDGYNRWQKRVVNLSVDEYGNGVVGAYNSKGEGRTLTPGP